MSGSPELQLQQILDQQNAAWEERPLVRRLYLEWFRDVAARLAQVPGPSIELGSGIARLREIIPDIVETDVEPTRWTDVVADAEELPWSDGSVANLVLIDVYHHLARPSRFLDEARRVLAPRGRAVILEPYCSPISTVAYKCFHHEVTDLSASAFDDDPRIATAPMAANQARATLAFFRSARTFHERWPELRIVERRRLAIVMYPLSGGLSGRQLAARPLWGALGFLERAAAPLLPLAAFRCLVVLERVSEA